MTELGSRIDPENDLVDVDGTAVQLDQSKRYVMLNKPTGVVISMKDDRGRPDLRRFTEDWDERLYNVGRLDADTSGLLVLTNDGDSRARARAPVVRGDQGLHREGRRARHAADDRDASRRASSSRTAPSPLTRRDCWMPGPGHPSSSSRCTPGATASSGA